MLSIWTNLKICHLAKRVSENLVSIFSNSIVFSLYKISKFLHVNNARELQHHLDKFYIDSGPKEYGNSVKKKHKQVVFV